MAAAHGKMMLNFNVGVVGHIDSGKTALSKVLSTTASTACFDKNPQSQERGITIDLGFSSFVVDAPEALRGEGYDKLQITLVDCPGHASLIRTIIGGSQIIDMMLLVIDVTKGMQTQTAECLVLGEITTSRMVVALNKIDLLPEEKRSSMIEQMEKKMQKTLEQTRFAGCPIVPVAAKPGGTEVALSDVVGLRELVSSLLDMAYLPSRTPKGPFVFAVDHCFSLRGQGTVMTGTVVSGSIGVGDNVEVPSLKEVRKVKSIQMFKRAVESACQGDRVGICVAQFDSKLVERGVVCSPDDCPLLYAAIVVVRPIRFFKSQIGTKAKFHISIGHCTVMATCHFFAPVEDMNEDKQPNTFEWHAEYVHCDELEKPSDEDLSAAAAAVPSRRRRRSWCYVLLEFEKPIVAPQACLVIGSRLDADIRRNSCRLAFEGRLLHGIHHKTYAQTVLPNLKIYKVKCKQGVVDRAMDSYTVIGRSLFRKEANLESFLGMKVHLSSGESGVIEGGFGQSGKIKIHIHEGLKDTTLSTLMIKDKKRGPEKADTSDLSTPQRLTIHLSFKRYVFDPKKSMIQS